MDFLCWSCPTEEEQKSFISKCRGFVNEGKHKGASDKPASLLQEDKELAEEGWFINHSKASLGSGLDTYEKAKAALQSWRQYGMNWTYVDPKTPVQTRVSLCICVKAVFPWIMLPVQMVFVNESTEADKPSAYFSYGFHGLKGNLLAGEERFSVELDESNQVWYEILSFSKPDRIISKVVYPYMRLRQKYFASESSKAMQQYVSSN